MAGDRQVEPQPPVEERTPTWFINGFHAFLRPYLRRHFHVVAIHAETLPDARLAKSGPVIVYGNHPSWWDPLIAQFLCREFFREHIFRAPIDASALEQYSVFKKLGFYGIEMSSRRGAADFLRHSMEILQQPTGSIWMTPEGRFADVRDHQAELMPGLAHLCSRVSGPGHVLPLALEYAFWEEKLPACFVRFGQPIPFAATAENEANESMDKGAWKELLRESLRANQKALASAVIARDPACFQVVLSGGRGAGVVYDTFRRLKCWVTRRPFQAAHGRKFNA